jgi:hypothetical protein
MTSPQAPHRPSAALQPEQLTPKVTLWLKAHLWAQVMVGMILGIGIGLVFSLDRRHP